MARLVSLNARQASNARESAEVEVVLLRFRHPGWTDDLRVTSDPTERFSVDPLVYGTRSRWWSAPGAAAQEYVYAPLSVLLPDENDEQPPMGTLVVELVDYKLVAPARGFIRREVTVDMALVLASSPDVIEFEFRNMLLLGTEGNASRLSLTVGLEDDEDEPHCRIRMTRDNAPSLWR